MPSLSKAHLRSLAKGLPLAALVCALFVYTRAHHEFWRDEAQALLLGRAVPLRDLLRAMRYEGTPPLFHLLLTLLCSIASPPTALALGGAVGYAALLAGTYHVLRVLSRRPWASLGLTAALGCTNTWIYELGVVVRPYGLGLGLDLLGIGELIVAHRLNRSRRALSGTLLCAAGALTSAHAACVAGAALASFVITELSSRPWRLRGPTSRVALALHTLAALPAFALTFWLMSPLADRTVEAMSPQTPSLSQALSSAGLFLESGALVVPWWPLAGAPRLPWARLFAAAMAVAFAVRLWRGRDRRTFLFLFGTVALSWATLLYIFVVWYGGGYRHHLFLWMPALVMAIGFVADGRFARGRSRLALIAFASLLLPWMGYQYWAAWFDLSRDRHDAFSQTKHAAALLPGGAHVLSDHDYTIVGLQLWRDDLTLRSQDGRGRRFRYLLVDRAWHQRAPLQPLLNEECRAAPDRVYFAANVPWVEPKLLRCAKLEGKRMGLVPSEGFDLYHVNCACALR